MTPLVYIPLAFAELLHVTLGPLGDRLKAEGHEWASLVEKVLDAYTSRRDEHLHGEDIEVQTSAAMEELEHIIGELADERKAVSQNRP